jgi:hypothetical protein
MIALSFFMLTMLFFVAAGRLAAQDGAGVCAGQAAMMEGELNKAVGLMRDIMAKGGRMTPEEEERLITQRGLASDRLNCILGKLIAANDVFGWGGPEAYGAPLSAKELSFAGKYKKDAERLKKYMEDVLNIRAE